MPKNVNKNQKGFVCTSCKHWIHIKCNGTSSEDYQQIVEYNSGLSDEEIEQLPWDCNKCLISQMANTFPFGLQTNEELFNEL